MAVTAEQARLFNQLRRMGATSQEAGLVVDLATAMSSVSAIDLARRHSTSWMHERRGAHGEWESAGGSPANTAMISKAMRASKRRRPLAVASSAASPTKAVTPDNTAHAPAFVEHVKTSEQQHEELKTQLEEHSARVLAEAQSRMDAMKAEHMATLLQTVKDNNARLAEQGEKTEKKAANKKLAIEGSVAAAGVIAALVEARLGVPDLVAVGSTLVGPAVQILYEWKNRL